MFLYVLKKKNITLGGTAYRKMLVVAENELSARELAYDYCLKNENGFDGVDTRDEGQVECGCVGRDVTAVREPKVLFSFLVNA